MSSFMRKFKHRASGEIHEVLCWDDYYGNHNYGYKVPSGDVLTQDQFDEKYEALDE